MTSNNAANAAIAAHRTSPTGRCRTALRPTLLAVTVMLGLACTSLDDGDVDGSPSSDGDAGTAESAPIEQLDVGACFDEPTELQDQLEGEVRTVEPIGCEHEHDSEVYHVGRLDDGDFPGDAAAQDLVRDACLERFDDFVGIDYDESRLDVSFFYPSASGWEEGDRRYVCSIFDLNGGRLQGSMADTGY